MTHTSHVIDPLIGKKVKVVFKGGCSAIGVVERRQWRYGMHGYIWMNADKSIVSNCNSWLTFCKSVVQSIKEEK